jgi:hypothetical protein
MYHFWYILIARKGAPRRCSIGCAASTRTTGALSGSTSCGCNSAGRLGGHWSEAGLWEVRSSLPSQRIARLILCFHDQTIVVLHGFIKKTYKTPTDDLALAKRRMKEVTK